MQRVAGEILHRGHDQSRTILFGDFGFHDFHLGMGRRGDTLALRLGAMSLTDRERTAPIHRVYRFDGNGAGRVESDAASRNVMVSRPSRLAGEIRQQHPERSVSRSVRWGSSPAAGAGDRRTPAGIPNHDKTGWPFTSHASTSSGGIRWSRSELPLGGVGPAVIRSAGITNLMVWVTA
jgi:hypothetical protein